VPTKFGSIVIALKWQQLSPQPRPIAPTKIIEWPRFELEKCPCLSRGLLEANILSALKNEDHKPTHTEYVQWSP
jgi:hypothetical protein